MDEAADVGGAECRVSHGHILHLGVAISITVSIPIAIVIIILICMCGITLHIPGAQQHPLHIRIRQQS